MAACHSLGDLGGFVFTLIALAWGAWQAYMRTRATSAAAQATREKDDAVRELALSLRPTQPYKPSLATLEGQRAFGEPPAVVIRESGDENR